MKPPHSPEPPDRERFLAAVAAHVPVDRVVELYLFQPIRQGGVESGVAVIAASGDAHGVPDEERRAGAVAHRDLGQPPADSPASETVVAPAKDAMANPAPATEPERSVPRYTVFTAHYRHVLKGPERGRWEVSVVAEADAPLATVGAVVRGVQRRAGDVDPPEHMTGDALREALGQES